MFLVSVLATRSPCKPFYSLLLSQLLAVQVLHAASLLDLKATGKAPTTTPSPTLALPAAPKGVDENPFGRFFATSSELISQKNKTSWIQQDRTWPRKPWRSHQKVLFPSASTRSNATISKRSSRMPNPYDPFDNSWVQYAEENAPGPFYTPLGHMNPFGSSIFNPHGFGNGDRFIPDNVPIGGDLSTLQSGNKPFNDDFNRPPKQAASDRSPYFGGQKGGRNGQFPGPPPPPPPPPPPSRDSTGPDRSRRYRPDKRFGPPPGYGGPPPPRDRKGSGSGSKYPPEGPYSYGPDYEDGVPRYSYNPTETPRCAKDSNTSYCVEDSEYPV